jgi:hypothetical protein
LRKANDHGHIAVAAIKRLPSAEPGHEMVVTLAGAFEVHPYHINNWKRQLLGRSSGRFLGCRGGGYGQQA